MNNLLLEVEGPIAVLTINRPKALNALNSETLTELNEVLTEIEGRDDIKVVILTGAGEKAFVAGADIGEMSTLSKEQIRDEIMQVHKNVKELTRQNMCFFRPPYGDYNNLLIQTATECGYLSIQWDIDSLDWKDYGVQSIIDRTALNPELSNGSIILMHNGAKYTKDALETVISTLQSKGYEFVTLSELVYKDHFHMDPSGKQIPD